MLIENRKKVQAPALALKWNGSSNHESKQKLKSKLWFKCIIQ